MSGRVVRHSLAKRDLIKHFVYLAEQSDLSTARRFRDATNNAFELLTQMPELGAQRDFKSAKLTRVRMWPIKGFREFLIFYEPTPDGIRIIRVIHAKEDYWRVFGE